MPHVLPSNPIIGVVAALFLLHTGCATSASHLQQVHLGDQRSHVVKTLGKPTVARGSVRNKFGQVVEVYEYRLAMPIDDSAGELIGKSAFAVISFGMGAVLFRGERRNYWLYFVDDELVQWGEAGDWSREADRIHEFRFETRRLLSN